MSNYYLPKNYLDTEKGARLYIKDIKASDREKEEIRLITKAVKAIINYNKSNDTQSILNILEENDSDDGTMMFSVDLWDKFTSDLGDKIHKKFIQRKKRINSQKKQITLASNDEAEYKIKYYLPDAYPDSAEGMREYFSDLIRNANTDEEAKTELLLSTKVMKLIEGYHTYKEKEPVHEAIRNKPELFGSEMFRNFLADINSNEYKPAKKYKHRDIEEKHLKVVANVKYYKNMGLPVYYESTKSNKLNASQLTADKIGLKKSYVEEIYKKSKKDNNGWTSSVRQIDGKWLSTWDGICIWVLNGFRPPETEETLEQLEKLLISLSEDKYKKVEKFSRQYGAKGYKLPTTKKELKKRKKILSGQEYYEFIKSLQIKEISLKN